MKWTFYLTCGQGMQCFAKSELKEKFKIVSDDIDDSYMGKVFFPVVATDMIDLREKIKNMLSSISSAERLFGLVTLCDISTRIKNKNTRKRKRSGFLSGIFESLSKAPDLSTRLQEVTDVCKMVTEVSDEEGPPTKRYKPSLSFRVNAKISNNLQRIHDVSHHDINKCVASSIVRIMHRHSWEIQLRNPDVEISVNLLSDVKLLIGISFCKKPLADRYYLKHTPLRSTIAYAMCHTAISFLETSDKNGFDIIDPMSGQGTILIEMAISYPQSCNLLVGIERNQSQILRFSENLQHAFDTANMLVPVCPILGDAQVIGSSLTQKFDCIICDLPFGRLHGTVHEVRASLPSYISDFKNMLYAGGVVVLLISSELAEDLENAARDNDMPLLKRFHLSLGKLIADLLVFKKKALI